MPDKQDHSTRFEKLREKAERLIQLQPQPSDAPTLDILELIHELKIHQAELEIQNEELQRAHHEIADLHQEYENLYEFAPCGYLTLNNKGIITHLNLTGSQILDTDRRYAIRRRFSNFIDSGFEDIFFTARKKHIETGKKQSIELPIKRKDDPPLWVRADIEADRDEADAVTQWRIVLLDITVQKQAEKEQEKLQDQLSQLQKAESLGRMAGSIAHHFNNQLSVVMGNLELALDDLPDDSDNREILFESFEAGRKAAKVSQQMLHYLGHISDSKTTINLSDVCRQSLDLLQSVSPSGVTFNVDFPDSGPMVHADAGQIQQVIW